MKGVKHEYRILNTWHYRISDLGVPSFWISDKYCWTYSRGAVALAIKKQQTESYCRLSNLHNRIGVKYLGRNTWHTGVRNAARNRKNVPSILLLIG